MDIKSPNFDFLKNLDPALLRRAAMAERYCIEDPPSSLMNQRLFAEMLAKNLAARFGIYTADRAKQTDILRELKYQGVIEPKIAELFHNIRMAGNEASHEGEAAVGAALRHLRFTHQLAVFFYRTVKSPSFQPGPFKTPPNPSEMTDQLKKELEDARDQIHFLKDAVSDKEKLTEAEIRKREQAEAEAAAAWAEFEAAMELARQVEEESREEIALYEEELSALQVEAEKQTAAQFREAAALARDAADKVELSEADTRKLIDRQLREAGWEADTENIRYAGGIRPEKGKNKAIAEWSVKDGRADYALFSGLKILGVVEAKRKNLDVSAAVDQAKRYSRDFIPDDALETPGGPWDGHKVPFAFAANGRPYLRQMQNQSGVWFCDLRRPQNLRRALESWYTPEGLKNLLEIDIDAAEQTLDQMDFAFEFPLRPYQKKAIQAVEAAIRDGRQAVMLAMATGTGKTKTCIALCYRLLKSKRFRRILFLVDRSALGEQAENAFKDTEITGLQKFADIFAIKELKDREPDIETDVHIATIQGMVRRVLYTEDESEKPAVDRYDCIIVDECHRGYLLDQEISDSELAFRDLQDYISKYRRVLDYFDALKIGLTATPALHTVEIFGMPVFTYSYREAVLDGYLVDHEPPVKIATNLSTRGIHWEKGDTVKRYTRLGQLELFETPDELDFEVAQFNKRVITESFNQTVCRFLASEIDPNLPEKTLIFCVNDRHADLVVRLLKDAFKDQYGDVEDDAVAKITGKAHKPLQLIRRYKNERLPNVAVTVDLLTTGVDVLSICNLVFIRKVNSRILYDQMIGRATRLCPEIGKEVFRIFDAVDVYADMQDYTDMKPVVNKPHIRFAELEEEMIRLKDEEALQTVKEQFIVRLRRKKKYLTDRSRSDLKTLTGMTPDELIQRLLTLTAEDAAQWFAGHMGVGSLLDAKGVGDTSYVLISEHEDELTDVTREYGEALKPEDYIETFTRFIRENVNRIAALELVVKRPSDLTRKDLRELRLRLEEQGFRELDLKTAYHTLGDADIAAGIIGFIRRAALGDPLVPYEQRVDAAINRMLSSRGWTGPQKQWLKRIGAQMKKEIIVDRTAMNQAQFRDAGGFDRINRVFGGELEQILQDMVEQVWEAVS